MMTWQSGGIEDGEGKEPPYSRGRNQDRARVGGGQDYEVRYAAKKTQRSAAAVKKAVRKLAPAEIGSSAGSDVRNGSRESRVS